MENKFDKIKIKWRHSEKGKVCTATVVSDKGKVVAKHITIPNDIITDFHRAFGGLGDEEIEKAAREELKFILENPDLFE